MKRREILAAGGGLATSLLVPKAFAQDVRPEGVREIRDSFAPVKSKPERVIRSVVGLRPYRSQGFRLEAERISRRDVIHNYGHGGGGVSLSWGCSELAADMAQEAGRNDVAVIGAGVMGLTTARVLQQRGANVTIYAEAFPPDTTSNIAGAMWLPTSLYDREAATPEFLALLDLTSQRSFRRFQAFANDPRYGVFWIRQHQMSEHPPSREPQPYPGGDDLYPGVVRRQSGNGPLGYPYWDAFFTLMIDPDIYLRALVMDFIASGGRLVERRFDTARDVLDLRERTIVNCSGLGAAALFEDPDLIPARGQLTMLLPQPEIDYGYATAMDGKTLYMFPRKSAVVLGGSFEKGNYSLEVDPDEVTRMVEGHALIASRA